MRYNGLTSIIRQILDDREWHDVLDLVIQTRHCIPPEVAIRAYEQQQRTRGRAFGQSMTWCLNKGRRHVVIKVISALLHQKRGPPIVEVRRVDSRKIIAVRKL